MSYYIPRTYVCPKCTQEAEYSPSESFYAPVIKGSPICPFCYAKFLMDNVPIMSIKEKNNG